MKEPDDDDVCQACEHTWKEHVDDDAERWKTGCECCLLGVFVGQPVAVDDLDAEDMAAWNEKVRRRK